MPSKKEPRAEATRRAIVESAAVSFYNDGYTHSSLNEMCARAGVTKGAMYFHFSTKEDLAESLINDYLALVNDVYENLTGMSGTGLEVLIDWTFSVFKALSGSLVALAGSRLIQEFGSHNPASKRYSENLAAVACKQIESAIENGDAVTELEPAVLADNLVMQLRGVQSLNAKGDSEREEMLRGVIVWWSIVIAALVPEKRRSFFDECLRRRAQWALAGSDSRD